MLVGGCFALFFFFFFFFFRLIEVMRLCGKWWSQKRKKRKKGWRLVKDSFGNSVHAVAREMEGSWAHAVVRSWS